MKILGNNIPQSILKNHLNTFGPTLFNHFDKYQSILLPDFGIIAPTNFYVCPLCTKSYFNVLADGIRGNAEFSLDHIPPNSVGGSFTLLTCKKCNNDAGTNEAELSKLLEFGMLTDKNFLKLPKVTIARKGSSEEIKAFAQRNSNTELNFIFSEHEKKHNPLVKKFIEELHSGKLAELELRWYSPDLKKIGKALLKSSYLLCFLWWGYEFIYSQNGEMIRKVLNDEIEYPVIIPTLWRDIDKDTPPIGIGILKNEGVSESYIVNLGFKNNNSTCIASILIPNPTTDGWSKLKELDEYIKLNNTLKQFELINLFQIIPPNVNGYTNTWNSFVSKSQF